MNFYLPKRFPLLPRKKNSDKSDYGHTLVVAGSIGMSGAAILASEGALTAGSGLVTLATPRSCQAVVAKRLVEVMTWGLPETARGTLKSDSARTILDFCAKRKITALALGPGLSHQKNSVSMIRKLVRKVSIPCVLDADGLNAFAKAAHLFRSRQSPLVLTPHAREFERLFQEAWPPQEAKRIVLAKKLSKFYDVVLALKGHRSLVISKDRVYRNLTGNPGMAKGGSGDVLTGIIAAFISQGLDFFQAACWAVYFHGMAGDVAVRKKGELSLRAQDLLASLPSAFNKFSKHSLE